jgi:predicted MFS family arabinose efflux permease
MAPGAPCAARQTPERAAKSHTGLLGAPRFGTGGPPMLAVVFAAAQFIVVLDASAVNVALPRMADGLRIGPSQLQWVITSYSVAFGGLLLAGGHVADVLGPRRVFIAGTWMFLMGSLAAGLATSFPILVGARCVQGTAAAVLTPAGFGLLTAGVRSHRQRARAIGLMGSMLGAGFAVGTLVGGVLTVAFSWRAVFLVNVPVAAAIALLAHTLGPPESSRGRGRIGLTPAIAITLGLGGVLFAIAQLDLGPPNGSVAVGATVAIAGIAVFLRCQRRSERPLIPRSLVSRSVWKASATIMLTTGADAGVFVFLTVYLQQRRGLSPLETTAVLIIPGIVTIAAGRLAGTLVTVLGVRRCLIVSLWTQAGAIALMAERTPPLAIVVTGTTVAAGGGAASRGGGAAPATPPAGPEQGGSAGSLVNAANQIGAALGVALVAFLVGVRELSPAAGSSHATSGVWPIMLVAAALAAGGALVARGMAASSSTDAGPVVEEG